MNIVIDEIDFWEVEAQKYYSFSKTYKGNKKAKAKELIYSERYYGSRKMDGIWCMIIKDTNGNFHARTRAKNVNKTYDDKAEWIPHIINELKIIPKGSVLVGEIYFPDDEGSRKVTSVFNCLKEKCLKLQEKKRLHFYVFDMIAWDNVALNNNPCYSRFNMIKNFSSENSFNYIEFANYIKGPELWELYLDIIENGGEGIVIQREDHTYEFGKRTAWKTLKLKKELEDTIDAFIDGNYKKPTKLYNGKELESWKYWINFKTGERFNECKFSEYSMGYSSIEPVTKAYYYNWASAISFSVMKNGLPKHIAWISGISDELKEEIVNNPSKWVNKVAELSAMEIEKINGIYSLRHGKIEKWREDKKPEDCDYSQIEK